MAEQHFKPSLGLRDATMIVAGSMIGSGIFIVSADIVRNVGSPAWLIMIWLLAGFMTMMAALSYGELSGMFPKAGGQYVYLREAYHPLLAFLYGWSFFAIIQTGTIAAVGVAFSRFTAYLIPAFNEDNLILDSEFLKISSAQVLSIACLVFLTFLNTRGVEKGKHVQTVFTITKLLSLFGLIVFGFIMMKAEVWNANWSKGWNLHSMQSLAGENGDLLNSIGLIAAAMVGSIFSYDAWNNVTFIAGEIKDPKRNIGLSLLLGTLMVTCIYVLANVMYLSVLPLDGIAHAAKDRVGVAASQIIFGDWGTIIIALMIMISTFGCNNGLILAGARVYYTMAKDGLFFRQAGELNKFNVPQPALWMQCVLASFWCLSGKYGDLLDMVSFVVVLFYILTVAGVFILRKRRPDAERPYKTFAYPVLPILYIIMGAAFCILLIIYKPRFTWPGLLITLAGIPIYYLAMGRRKKD
ncbi:MAG: APC family permease [Cytophagaceae bacterium]